MVINPADYSPERLRQGSAQTLFAGCFSPEGVLAGLWLHHGDLDRAHKVAQDLDTSEGSFWHGIMHRLEPDPSNAKYWFRQVGKHPTFPTLRDAAAAAGYSTGAAWDPFAWIDFWESARRQPNSGASRLADQVQRLEWQILFDYCAREMK